MDDQDSNPVRKRRRPRFSLKWLFVLVTLMACLSPRLANRYYEWKANRQRKGDIDAIHSVLGQEESAIYFHPTDEAWEQSRREHAQELRRLRDALEKAKVK